MVQECRRYLSMREVHYSTDLQDSDREVHGARVQTLSVNARSALFHRPARLRSRSAWCKSADAICQCEKCTIPQTCKTQIEKCMVQECRRYLSMREVHYSTDLQDSD